MWASGVCQRIVSDTMEGISEGLSRSFLYWSGFWFSASTLPVMVLRVVSLPPTVEQHDIAEIFARLHVPRGGIVRQHGDQIAFRLASR